MNNPAKSVELTTGNLLLNLAFGTDYLLKTNINQKNGLVFGFRIGYRIALIKSDWGMEKIDIYGGPDIGITGPYICFMIGGGGFNN